MNQKNIVAILGVVVVGLIGTTVYFATINKANSPVAQTQPDANQPAPTPTPEAQQPTQSVKSQATNETSSWLTYTNTELGISFQYPPPVQGQFREYRDGGGKLTSVTLRGEQALSSYIGFMAQEDDILRSCKDILANGTPGKETDFPSCNLITVDNAPFDVLDYQPPIDTRVIEFQTKKGVWSFITDDKNLYDVVTNIAKTVKHLK